MSDLSRRRFLALGSAAGAAAAAAAAGVTVARREAAGTSTAVAFAGPRQAGIETRQQAHLAFGAFDLTTPARRDVIDLLAAWTDAGRLLVDGRALRSDSGETAGLDPARLTVTFGFGATLFERDGVDRYGLAARRPAPLVDMPAFRNERLDPASSNGDLCVQACSDDPQVALHAVRNLARVAHGTARLRWLQEGFLPPPGGGAPRNLMGFRDGTNNLRPGSADAERYVWVRSGDDPAWMRDGTYVVARRIRMHLEKWDASPITEQERVIGRHKASGAPLGGVHENDKVVIDRLPEESHVRLANQHKNGVGILRRSYSFAGGADPHTGELEAGLFFIAFQRDPRTAFLPLQRKLSQVDEMNEYILHTTSAMFAVPPGVAGAGGYIGEPLFASSV